MSTWYLLQSLQSDGVSTIIKFVTLESNVETITFTGVKDVPQVEGLNFTVTADPLYTGEGTVDLAEHGLAPIPAGSYFDGGMWTVPDAPKKCAGAGRLLINRHPINDITGGATIGDHKATNLANDNRGMPFKADFNPTDLSNGDRTSLMTVTTDIALSDVGDGTDPQVWVDGDDNSGILVASDDISRYIQIDLLDSAVITYLSISSLWTSGAPHVSSETWFSNITVKAQRKNSEVWETIATGLSLEGGLGNNYLEKSGTAYRFPAQPYVKRRLEGVTNTHPGTLLEVNEISMEAEKGVIRGSLATDTLVTSVVMTEVITHSDAHLRIQGPSIDGDEVDVYYPAIPTRFGLGEAPNMLTQGLYTSGHYTPDQSSEFIAYIPPIVGDYITVTVSEHGDVFQSTGLFLYADYAFVTDNYNHGSTLTYIDQDDIDFVQGAVRREIVGDLKSKTVNYQFASEEDQALISRTYRDKLTVVLDAYPEAKPMKRQENLIVGYIVGDKTITHEAAGAEFPITIQSTKVK